VERRLGWAQMTVGQRQEINARCLALGLAVKYAPARERARERALARAKAAEEVG